MGKPWDRRLRKGLGGMRGTRQAANSSAAFRKARRSISPGTNRVTQIQRFLANISRFPEPPLEGALLSPRPIHHREASDSAYLGAVPIM